MLLLAAACGGSDAGTGGVTTPPAPDNTPTAVTLSQTGALTLVSGTTTTISATVLARDGRSLGASGVTWTSSDPSIASVSGGTVSASRVGTATITASIASLTANVAVTVTPGAAAALAIRTQPVGTTSGSALAAQPVIEIRDLAGNLVTSSTASVTVTIGSGGGTLSGSTTVAAVGGIATFSGLAISGAAGDRTLVFTSTGLAPVTSGAVTIAAPAGAVLTIDNSVVTVGATSGVNASTVRLNVTSGGAVAATGLALDAPVYDANQPTGWLAPSLAATTAPTTLTLTFSTAALPAGTYHASFHLLAGNATNGPLTVNVTLSVSAAAVVAYGTASDRIKVIDIGSSYLPTSSLTVGGSPIANPSFSYTSRAASVASVGSDGRITARAAGDAWIVATTSQGADSVYVVVPLNSTGPVIRASVTNYSYALGDTAFVSIVLDTRGTTVGAGTFAANVSTPFGGFYGTPTSSPVPTVALDGSGVLRIAIGSATGMTGVIPLVNLKFTTRSAGSGFVYLSALDVSGVDGKSLIGVTSVTRFPLVFK